MKLERFKKRMDSRRDNAQADLIEKMREYIACSCARAFADTIQETYQAIGFTDEPQLEVYDISALFGTNSPEAIVIDQQITQLDDVAFGEFKLELASHWKVNSVGLKIEHTEPDVIEAHFLIPADADKVVAAYKELIA